MLWVHSPRLAACAVIPADAGIQKPDWMPPAYHMPGQAYQVRHDAEYPAACGGVVYWNFLELAAWDSVLNLKLLPVEEPVEFREQNIGEKDD
jgi:hypothetical protein